mmetsp:Transcript_12043/g.20468  ORF Transcript_12043/g.20468 Transcript_12043/m.20468 type:complete len:169 (+) Transcript_12043:87-593(+)
MISSTLRATLLCFLATNTPAAAFTNHRITNTASHTNKTNNHSSYRSSELNLYNSVEEAIGEAQRVCNEQGGDSEACKVAWDIVEELEAADAHRTPATPTSQQELSYGPLIMSLDLLSAKIDRKMDELNKLSTSLVEAGAGPEVERLAYASEEMKGILEEAVRSLDQYR